MADDKGTAATKEEAAVEEVAEKAKGSKPEGQGEYDGEVKDGWQYSRRDRSWIEWKGVDHSQEKGSLPYGYEHVGDGSAQNPHRVQQKQSW